MRIFIEYIFYNIYNNISYFQITIISLDGINLSILQFVLINHHLMKYFLNYILLCFAFFINLNFILKIIIIEYPNNFYSKYSSTLIIIQ